MVRSKEFPQYEWQPLVRIVDSDTTRWTPGRKSGQPSIIFIHTTEGTEGPSSAEAGGRYDARRTDGTSCHFFCDQDSAVQEVLTTDEAHAARAHGNDVGIQIEVCGRAGQTSAQWADAASVGTIEQTAGVCVALREKYGKAYFPLVNLTPAQLRAGAHGFAEHKDATLAWPEDGGTHTDPGPYFPWDKLFARIRALEMEQDKIMAVTLNEETMEAIAKKVWAHLLNINVSGVGPANMQPAGGIQRYLSSQHKQTQAQVRAVQADVDGITADVKGLGTDHNDIESQLETIGEDVVKILDQLPPPVV